MKVMGFVDVLLSNTCLLDYGILLKSLSTRIRGINWKLKKDEKR
jgi:hypothetical protein